MELFTTGGHCLNLMKGEVFRTINHPGLLLPYEISNRGNVRYVLSTGQCVYIDIITVSNKYHGSPRYVTLSTVLGTVTFDVDILRIQTFRSK